MALKAGAKNDKLADERRERRQTDQRQACRREKARRSTARRATVRARRHFRRVILE